MITIKKQLYPPTWRRMSQISWTSSILGQIQCKCLDRDLLEGTRPCTETRAKQIHPIYMEPETWFAGIDEGNFRQHICMDGCGAFHSDTEGGISDFQVGHFKGGRGNTCEVEILTRKVGKTLTNSLK